MDPTSSNKTSDAPSRKAHITEVSLGTASSSNNNVTSAKAGPQHVIHKHIIRRITHLDLQKLQQAGLDRKIAEALSKHKSEQKSKLSSQVSNDLKPGVNKDPSKGAINSTFSKPSNVEEATPGKNPIITYKIVPPKITITGPDAIPEHEKQKLVNLDPEKSKLSDLDSKQRMMHVKSLLNKKLLQKNSTEINDNAKTNQQLKIPTTLTKKVSKEIPATTKCVTVSKKSPEVLQTKCTETSDKRPTNPKNELTASPNLASVSTPISVKPVKTKTPQKSPQDIARKLDFQTDAHPVKQQLFKCLNKDAKEIPKTAVKASTSKQQYKSLPSNAAQNVRQLQQSEGVVATKPSYYVTNTLKKVTNFQSEYLKTQRVTYPNDIPKASIKIPYSSKQTKRIEPKLGMSESSLQKVTYPTVNVTKEKPLPAIDSFKKPYPIVNSAYYDHQHKIGDQSDLILTDYETSLFNQEPTTPHMTSKLANTAAAATSAEPNCLIVLENKILSQDEMIDLTELRLSTSKFDTPRFINPHRPIPEVVIKQEHTDEYMETNHSNPIEIIHKTILPKELQSQNKEKISRLPNKQNKKVIINAQKLKLPPEKIAELAKKLKQQTSKSFTDTARITQANKSQNTSLINTEAASGKYASKRTGYVLPHNTEKIAQTAKGIPDKFVIKNKQMCSDAHTQDHNYQERDFKAIDVSNYLIAGKTNVLNATSFIHNSTFFDKSANEIQTKKTYSCDKSEKKSQLSENSGSLNCYDKSAVEIVDEPIEAADCFSAVDFIVALSNTNPITEEISLELSPEELNLNASCAMNLSPIRIQSYPTGREMQISQRTSTPKLRNNQNANFSKSPIKNTLVIKSANDTEAVLSNDSPNKTGDLKNVNKLQSDNVVNSKTIEKNEKFAQIGSKKPVALILSNKPSTESVDSVASKVGEPKMVDNLIVCDMEIEKTSEETLITTKASSKKREELKNNNKPLALSLATKSTNIAPSMKTLSNELEKPVGKVNESCHSKSQLASEPSKEPAKKDLANAASNSKAGDILKNITTEKNKSSNDFIEILESDTNSKILTHNVTNSESLINLETASSKPSDNEITTNNNNITKLSKEIEAAKTCEMSSSATVTSKRISRFKKGKINLVQRNKAGHVGNKTLSDDKKTIVVADPHNELNKKSINETKETLEQAKPTTSFDKNKGNIKDTRFVKAITFDVKQIGVTAITDNKLPTSGATENLDQTIQQVNEFLPQQQFSSLENKMFPQDSNTQKSPQILNFPAALLSTMDKRTTLIKSQDIKINKPLEGNITDTTKISKKAAVLCDSSQKQLAHKSDTNEPKTSIKTDNSSQKQHINSPKKESINTDKKLKSSDNITKKETAVAKAVEQSNLIQDNIEITEPSTNITKQFESTETRTFMTQEKIENLSQESKAILESMKTAKIPLVDIIKHSPIKSPKSYPVKAFLNPIKSGHEEEAVQSKQMEKMKTLEGSPTRSKAAKESFGKIEEKEIVAKKRSSRSVSRTCESRTETPSPAISTRKRHSTRPLISDDDLEFLPENAEVKFMLSKSIQKEKSKECITDTGVTTETHARRQSLYSKPLELELFKSSAPASASASPTKRTRYYSQTLETNVTITFDSLKSNANLPKNAKPLETEESCHDSTPDSCSKAPTKQHKKLRKTLLNVKETQKSHNDTDSEDDNRDYDDCVMRDCEESNEFLGFEEQSESGNSKNTQPNVTESDHEAKAKHGTLQNWLTTGKAISPTSEEVATRKRLRQKDELVEFLSSMSVIQKTKKQIPIKKRKVLYSVPYDETDISDDTSPSDDEEEFSEQISISKKFKRGVENVIDISKKLIDSKEINLDDSKEQSFVKPRNLRAKAENSGSDSDSDSLVKEAEKSERQKATISEITDKNDENVVEISCSKLFCREEKSSEGQRFQDNTKKSGTDSDCQESTTSRHLKSKGKANITKQPNDRSKSKEKHSRDTDSSQSSACKGAKEPKSLESKNKAEDIDKNLEIECPKSKRSKQNTSQVKNENFDIPQKQGVAENSENSNDRKNTNESSTEKNSDLQLTSQREIEGIDSENSIIAKDIIESEQSAVVTPQNLATKKKRGRPRKAETSMQMRLKKSVIYDTSEDEGPSTSTKKHTLKVPTKRSRKTEDSDSDSLSTLLNKTQEHEGLKPISAPRGRRKINAESNFNPRLLLITKREQLETDETLTESEPGTGSLQCGLCLKRTERAKWGRHIAEHYGVGWKVGEDKLHIENRSVVLSNILKYMKATGSNGLTCRMCKKEYRSALGILTHIEACGAEAIRVVCEFCKRDYVKTSLLQHQRNCFARKALECQSSEEQHDESNEKREEIFGNTGRLKRNSTIKAENKLKVLGAELEEIPDNVNKDKADVDPKSRIRYVTPNEEDFHDKWSKDIKDLGQASCPKSRCKFTSNDLKALSGHLKECKLMKSGYLCKLCRRVFQSEKEAIKHVIKTHQNSRKREGSKDSDCNLKTDDEQSSDDDDLSEGVDENDLTDDVAEEEYDVEDIKDNINRKCSKSKRNHKPRTQGHTCRKEVFDGRSKNLTKNVVSKWKRFLNSNYSHEPLYAEFTSQYSVINQPDLNKYLPAQTVSMKFNLGTKSALISTVGVPQKNIEWSELKRFTSISKNMNTYFFLGAPIKLCSWLPLPAYINTQYLAVVYRQDMFKFIKFSQPQQHHSIVLIFKVTQNNKVPELNIHYGFMVNDGPIHNLSFLPSGGYSESANRLGLVAVATIASCIKVYSLPLNVELAATQDNTSKNNITLIDVKPSFILKLDMLSERDEKQKQHVTLNPQCLQICWSEYADHQHIFAGFSNGFVGIWDILNNPQQNLNHFVVDNIINYAALNYFYMGEKSVKCFAVHYDTRGPRWLAVFSVYRKLVIYDIKNFMQPIIMKDEILKNIILSQDWCPLWENILYTYCDSLQNNGRSLVAISPNNIMFTQNKIDGLACGLTQVHYTPLTNMCVAGLNNGEIVFYNTKELHYESVLSKKFGERRVLYGMDIKQLNGEPLVRLEKGNQKSDTTPTEWTMHDVNYKQKYGLVFAPLLKINQDHRKTYIDEKRAPPINMTPLMRINTLRCNFNLNGKDLVALGYENGFLRLINFNKEAVFGN